jgi:RNA polymerase sigma-70 factor (ECF subfamily)
MVIVRHVTESAQGTGVARAPEPRLDWLAAASRDGDAAAFAELYETTAPAVFRYCYARTHNAADAEDLLQQTFLRVVEALPRYEERGVPFEAWLFRVCRSVAVDAHRRVRPQVPLGPDDEATLAAEGTRFGRDLLTDVLQALDGLTADQRQVIELRFFGDLSTRDIGLVMGRDEAAIRSMQSRALAALRRHLGATRIPRLVAAAAGA